MKVEQSSFNSHSL